MCRCMDAGECVRASEPRRCTYLHLEVLGLKTRPTVPGFKKQPVKQTTTKTWAVRTERKPFVVARQALED